MRQLVDQRGLQLVGRVLCAGIHRDLRADEPRRPLEVAGARVTHAARPVAAHVGRVIQELDGDERAGAAELEVHLVLQAVEAAHQTAHVASDLGRGLARQLDRHRAPPPLGYDARGARRVRLREHHGGEVVAEPAFAGDLAGVGVERLDAQRLRRLAHEQAERVATPHPLHRARSAVDGEGQHGDAERGHQEPSDESHAHLPPRCVPTEPLLEWGLGVAGGRTRRACGRREGGPAQAAGPPSGPPSLLRRRRLSAG